MLGAKRITDGESQSIKDVVTLQIHPDVGVPTTMFRMCPCFVQPRDTARLVAATSTDTPMSELPYNYGSLAYVAKWSSRGMKVEYRIYTRIVATVADNSAADDLARALDRAIDVVHVGPDALDTERLRFQVSSEVFFSKLDHNQRLAFTLNDNTVVGTITGLNVENTTQHFVQLTFADDAEAKTAHGYLVNPAVQLHWVNDPDPDAVAIATAIRTLNSKIDTLPMVMFGTVSRYEDVLQMGATVTLSVMMLGRAYLVVQPTFFDVVWVAGQDIYAVLTELDPDSTSTRLFDIQYVHLEAVPDTGVSVVYIGKYLGPSHHAYYTCCTVTLPPCVEAPIHTI